MKATKEIIYVNPDIYQGETGTSTIANVPMNSPIIYGDNPNLVVNEYGQTSLAQTPIAITPALNPKEQAQQLVNEIKDSIAEVKASKEAELVKQAEAKKETEPVKDVIVDKATPKKIQPKYLLYGLLGIVGVVGLIRIFKK